MLSKEFITETISVFELRQLKQKLNQLYKLIGIDIRFSRHFADRVNDPRNEEDITLEELTKLFTEVYKEYKHILPKLGLDVEVVLKDLSTKLNVPIAFDWDRTEEELDMVAKSVMRKNRYTTSSRVLAVK
jgi:hypothetical protein